MNDIRIFQIHFHKDHLASLDPSFLPLDNAGRSDPHFEFDVFRRIHGSRLTEGASLWGAFSWKFGKKTQMKGTELLRIINENPGRDVYYCNHRPDLEAFFQNLWLHGETRHPGLISLAKDIFTKAGLDPDICFQVEPTSTFSAANFFVASPAFWQKYIAFVDRVLKPAMADPMLKNRILSKEADPRGIHAGATYLPFIIERLFGVFLSTAEGQVFSAFKYPVPDNESALSPHHQRLRQMKQAAWQTRSSWMMQCWYGYRNLVLEILNGPEWAKTHLETITPARIVFAAQRPD